MNRRAALWGAAFLSTIVIISIFLLVKRADAEATTVNSAGLAAVAGNETAGAFAPATDFQQREAAWQGQIAHGQALLQALDATYQPQLAALQNELQGLEDQIAARTQNIADLQEQAAAAQRTAQAEAQRYQQQLIALQQRDGELRQRLANNLAAFQTAYDEINAGLRPGEREQEYGEDEHGSEAHEHEDDD